MAFFSCFCFVRLMLKKKKLSCWDAEPWKKEIKGEWDRPETCYGTWKRVNTQSRHPDLIFTDNLAAPVLCLVKTESLTRPAHCVFTLTQSWCSENPFYQAV